MNLLEHYIKEIFIVNHGEHEGIKYVKVKLKTNCYGVVEVRDEIFTEEEWANVNEKGYFMA